MADSEPVTSPDQHKPGHGKGARIGAIVTIGLLLAMTFDAHGEWAPNAWLLSIAGIIALILVLDVVLRRNGLRS